MVYEQLSHALQNMVKVRVRFVKVSFFGRGGGACIKEVITVNSSTISYTKRSTNNRPILPFLKQLVHTLILCKLGDGVNIKSVLLLFYFK